jgi:response regulator RpfG family c-di-GMP phosphodiesterase
MIQSLRPENNPELNRSILIVDDYSPTRQMLGEALTQAGCYEISEAENGLKALDQCRRSHFDLVISDVMMPDMGGMELLNRLREINPDTGVIMITANPALDMTVSAMKNGAIDFLKKPFDIDDLVFKVQMYFNEKKMLEAVDTKKDVAEIQITNKTKELAVHGYIYDSFEQIEGDNKHIFRKIVDLSLKVVDGEECSLLLFDERENAFRAEIIVSDDRKTYEQKTIPALKQIFHEAVEKKEALIIHSYEHPEIAPSLICAPLMIRDNVFGILCIRKKTNHELFTTKDLHYIVSLTKRASLNLENKLLYESMYNNVLDTFRSLVASVQVRDHYTEEHCLRVTKMAEMIAQRLYCTERDIESLKIAGMLHDVGKIAIPDNVLLKPDRLTFEEFSVIKTHSEIGERILKPILLFDQERHVVLHHHERWDGKGYPGGLAGNDIPLLSRILAVADTFDAMTNNRPYRSALDKEAAIVEINKNRNTQFDNHVVDAFMKAI